MLKFIFGCSASGKTYTVINMIKELALKGEQSVLIVPEQFSFESERAVLKALGDKAAQNVSVISFTRLCDEVGRNIGGIAGRTLTDADKVIFMNRALSDVAEELKLWGRYANSVFFAQTMIDTIGEFKSGAVSSDEIRKAAQNVESETLKAKLLDIALIYETYDSMMGEQFIDPSDNLTKLYTALEGYKFFENKTVFFDVFKKFTGQQYKIIDRILAQADNTVIALTNDTALNREYNVFTNVRNTAERIRESASRFKIAEDEPIILDSGRYNSADMVALERMLAGGSFEGDCLTAENITVCAAATATDEAEFTARTIRRLVREENYRYRDFVVIARNAEDYEESIFSACRQNGVPLFADRREPLSAFAVSVAVAAAIDFAIRPTTEGILRFHKTGLGTLNKAQISTLENYAFLWNINGSLWQEEWVMNPKGFVSDNKQADIEKLKEINELRLKAIAPLNKFKAELEGSAADMARAVFRLLEDVCVSEKLSELSAKFKSEGAEFSSEVLKQSYEKYIKLLDSLALCFGARTIKKQEFSDALALSVSLESVGVIPRMLDEVAFGSADRICPSRPKIAFILGANQGVFPRTAANTGVLRVAERRSLIELGLQIPDNQIQSVIDENFLIYCNLCCPSDKLFVSYAKNGLSGEVLTQSAFVDDICQKLNAKTVREPESIITKDNIPETTESAYSQYCRRMSWDSGAAELRSVLTETPLAKRVEFVEEKTSKKSAEISKDTARELFGSKIKMSASKLDVFHKCRFYFFCKYGLSAKKLQPADFDALQRGTIVHYVLEKAVLEYKSNLSRLSDTEIDLLVEKYIAEYLNGVTGYSAVETERSKFLVSRISRSLKAVLKQLAREFAQSEFEPVACELKIGADGEIPELIIPFDGGELAVEGSIDRVDKFGSYIRVIDYKTGTKSFKLPDALYGLNLQMLIYLYALTRVAENDDEKAAGILYMPSKRDTNDNGMAMNGLIRKDEEIVTAMEKELKGEFIPKLSSKSSFAEAEDFTAIFNYIEGVMKKMGKTILSGDIAVSPLDGRETPACKYCDYASVCGRENEPCEAVPTYSNSEVIEIMKEESENAI